jgi:ATP-dependent Clp protease ATP-binding subunit ClpB
MAKVVDIRLREVEQRLKSSKQIRIEVDDAAREWLAAAGFSPQYGARPLNRVIQREILFPLSRMVLDGSVREKETARISADLPANRIVIAQNHTPSVEMMDTDESDDGFDEDEDDLKVEPLD